MAYDQAAMRIAVAWRDLRRLKTLPLSVPIPQGQLDTMDVVAQLGSCNMVELSTALRIDASTATRAVDRLVETGLVERRRSPEDARTVLVELTKDGRRLERRLTNERLQHMEKVLADLSPAECEELAGALERLLAQVDTANAPQAEAQGSLE
jgi:DNA-binding MarR family transcriptional regulator